jgi:two-component system phosphate regulon sensor histidine kinase PhoR
MKRSSIWIIIVLMTVALAGIISLQTNWILSTIRLNEERFDKNVFAAIYHLAERLEGRERRQALESMNGFESFFFENELRQVFKTDRLDFLEFPMEVIPGSGLPNDRLAAFLLTQNDCDCESCRLDRQIRYYQIMQKRLQRQHLDLHERIGDLRLFDALLREELENAGIHTPFDYGIYSNESNNFIINNGHYVVPESSEQMSRVGGFDHLLNSNYRVSLFPEGREAPGFLMIVFPAKASAIWSSVIRNVVGSVLFMGIILFCFTYTILVIFRQKKISEMKNDFINNMTHEFKTPIATISLAADAISSPSLAGNTEKIGRFAEIIRQENRRMNNQVEKVLQMALIEQQNLEMKHTRVDIHDTIRSAIANFALQVESRDGVIHADLQAAHHHVTGDPTHLAAIIHNLLDNANKYSPEKPEITVRTRNDQDGCHISVEDKGIGIDRESQRHVFDRFFRVHTGNRHDVKGFGLGLSYVKAVMDAHGGWVKVKSDPGKGSTFSLVFPLSKLNGS